MKPWLRAYRTALLSGVSYTAMWSAVRVNEWEGQRALEYLRRLREAA